MPKRHLCVDWAKVTGASSRRKKLSLRESPEGDYLCPVEQCIHCPFKSKRGCRKHVDSRHGWYYYFTNAPILSSMDKSRATIQDQKKSCTSSQPSFSVEEGFGNDLVKWLCTPCGGGKKEKDAQQSGKRSMKFLMYCSGNNLDEPLTSNFVDCCLGSASSIMSFLQEIQDNWKLKSSGCLNYLKSIMDVMDFRKCSGVSDNSLRSFTVTEVYLRRGMRNLARKKKAEWSRSFSLESLIANNSWATVEEMEGVLPYHAPKFTKVVETCRNHPSKVALHDLVFATRFITTFLFLKVKCTRPMSYQYLTVSMLEKAKSNGGYIDQTEFKTQGTYKFDTIIIEEDVLKILGLYVQYCRPLLSPKCEYLLVTSNGNICQNLCHSMSLLVHEAIGKYIHPTRYRQIVETESSQRLNPEERETLSKDQKHSSQVAKHFYQKQLSREVAQKGKECMEKLAGKSRAIVDNSLKDIADEIDSLQSTFDLATIERTREILQGTPRLEDIASSCTASGSIATIITANPFPDSVGQREGTSLAGGVKATGDLVNNVMGEADVAIAKEVPGSSALSLEVKEEEMEMGKQRTRIHFTKEEDKCLRKGIEKYGRGSWASILRDPELHFHPTRNRNTLRIRADTAGFKVQHNV